MTDRCLIVAETGLNHNGSVDVAHAMIDAIAEAGADAAKFQAYRTSDFVTDRSLLYEGRSQVEMFERCELPDEAWPELRDHCHEVGVMFFATPTSEERLAMLDELGVALLKNGSDYLGHLPLIRAMARTGIRTVLATGMATKSEIDEAVTTFARAIGGRPALLAGANDKLVLMHCTSVYPCPREDVNLRKLETLAEDYGVPVGFSDHTIGTTAAIGAVTLGATMVEKHFTLNRSTPGPDHHFSANPDQLRELVEAVRVTEEMLGSGELEPTEAEREAREHFRVLEHDGRYLRR